MNLYRYLSWFGRFRNPHLRVAGVWALHVLGHRYLAIHIDPVQACNLRCRMCYFSNPGHRRAVAKGMISVEDLRQTGRALFHRALKLQVWCGAEPTLYPHLEEVVREGKRCGVPYISLTTNGQLLDYDKLRLLAEAGLDELTLSAHGVCRTTYEDLMPPAKFERFCQLLKDVARVKADYPGLRLRVNYTVNEDNVEELAGFWELFGEAGPDILQVRPIQQIGESDYDNFSLKKVTECYDTVLVPLQQECHRRGTVFIGPTKDNLAVLEADDSEEAEDMAASLICCYVYPGGVWKPDFDFRKDTFESYSRRTRRGLNMFKCIFARRRKKTDDEFDPTRKLNYVVR